MQSNDQRAASNCIWNPALNKRIKIAWTLLVVLATVGSVEIYYLITDNYPYSYFHYGEYVGQFLKVTNSIFVILIGITIYRLLYGIQKQDLHEDDYRTWIINLLLAVLGSFKLVIDIMAFVIFCCYRTFGCYHYEPLYLLYILPLHMMVPICLCILFYDLYKYCKTHGCILCCIRQNTRVQRVASDEP